MKMKVILLFWKIWSRKRRLMITVVFILHLRLVLIPLPINTMCHMLLPKDGSLFMKGLRLPIGIATKSQTLMYLL